MEDEKIIMPDGNCCGRCKYWGEPSEFSGDYYSAFCNNPSNDGKSGQSPAISFLCLSTKPLTFQNTICEFFEEGKTEEA